MVKHINEENFEQEVLNSDKPCLVDFYADWCGPCRALAPTLEKMAEKHADKVTIAKVNVDHARNLAMKYQVMSIPTIILFKNGQPVDHAMGAQPQSVLEQMITPHI